VSLQSVYALDSYTYCRIRDRAQHADFFLRYRSPGGFHLKPFMVRERMMETFYRGGAKAEDRTPAVTQRAHIRFCHWANMQMAIISAVHRRSRRGVDG
jgi:hypothetical protein